MISGMGLGGEVGDEGGEGEDAEGEEALLEGLAGEEVGEGFGAWDGVGDFREEVDGEGPSGVEAEGEPEG